MDRQDTAFDGIAKLYQAGWADNPMQHAAIRWLVDRLSPGAEVLDVGCGTGVPTAKALLDHGAKVTGIDVSTDMLDQARRQAPAMRIIQADIRDHEQPEGSLDAITAFFSLLLMPRADVEATLRRFERWLRPGGYLVLSMVTVPADCAPVRFLGKDMVFTGYAGEELLALVRGVGFEILGTTSGDYTPEVSGTQVDPQTFVCAQRPAV